MLLALSYLLNELGPEPGSPRSIRFSPDYLNGGC
jgi:hypothetical protein